MSHEVIYQAIREAVSRLASKGLVDVDACLSVRIPGADAIAICSVVDVSLAAPAEVDHQHPHPSRVADGLPITILPLGEENGDRHDEDRVAPCRAHQEIYRVRPDVGAIATSRLRWSSALARWREPVPAVFDEQVRQLGRSVELLDAAGDGLRSADRRRLRAGANAFLLDGGALCLGTNMQRLVLNTELLEKCAQAYVLARLTGRPVRKIPWIVRFIANRRLQRDQQRAAESYARGETPVGLTSY